MISTRFRRLIRIVTIAPFLLAIVPALFFFVRIKCGTFLMQADESGVAIDRAYYDAG